MSDRPASGSDEAINVMSADGAKLLAGLAIVFALFHGLGVALGSDRGQAGLTIAAIVVAALLAVEGIFFRTAPLQALRSLGFGPPAAKSMLAALIASLLLLAVIPAYAAASGASLAIYSGWAALLPGLFAQAGIAEEALFRGYLYGRLRRGRAFWPAAALATIPFAVVHLVMFATMPWPVALAARLLSIVISFPLAHLFERGGSIWPPALLHVTVQGAIKLVEFPADSALPIVWMAASAIIPFIAFAFRRSP